MTSILAVLAMGLPSQIDAARPRDPFNDTSTASWARPAAARLSAGGMLRGEIDGRFNGDKIATRFDAARLLVRLRQVRDLTSARTMGRDIALFRALTPAADERAIGLTTVDMLKDLPYACWDERREMPVLWDTVGVLQGFPDQYLRGPRRLTRGELAMISARVLMFTKEAVPTNAERAHFSDLAGDEWYFGAAVVACGAGVMQGYGDGTFRPSRAVTRNELAVALDRLATLLDRLKGVD